MTLARLKAMCCEYVFRRGRFDCLWVVYSAVVMSTIAPQRTIAREKASVDDLQSSHSDAYNAELVDLSVDGAKAFIVKQ